MRYQYLSFRLRKNLRCSWKSLPRTFVGSFCLFHLPSPFGWHCVSFRCACRDLAFLCLSSSFHLCPCSACLLSALLGLQARVHLSELRKGFESLLLRGSARFALTDLGGFFSVVQDLYWFCLLLRFFSCFCFSFCLFCSFSFSSSCSFGSFLSPLLRLSRGFLFRGQCAPCLQILLCLRI